MLTQEAFAFPNDKQRNHSILCKDKTTLHYSWALRDMGVNRVITSYHTPFPCYIRNFHNRMGNLKRKPVPCYIRNFHNKKVQLPRKPVPCYIMNFHNKKVRNLDRPFPCYIKNFHNKKDKLTRKPVPYYIRNFHKMTVQSRYSVLKPSNLL